MRQNPFLSYGLTVNGRTQVTNSGIVLRTILDALWKFALCARLPKVQEGRRPCVRR
jgi:hypothetical protein